MRKDGLTAIYEFEDIVGQSRAIKKTIEAAKKIASSDSTVLIYGESGTGKELFAQAIHNASRRRDGPFVPVNFPALPSNLLESELFEYEEGAFTGAKKGGKPGLFEKADGGTIFLDEIGDAPPDFQVKLLRVLQDKRIIRVGGLKAIPVDVRIIAATNKDLWKKVKDGSFRQDLYYRLSVLPVIIPPLRERKEDIFLLLGYYLEKYTGGRITSIYDFLDEKVLEYLIAYEWPGNVRELINLVEYLVSVKDEKTRIAIEDLPTHMISGILSALSDLSVDGKRETMIWIMKKIKEHDGIGRRTLAEIAKRENRNLGEGMIRRMMKQMEQDGLIELKKGAKGAVLTGKGKALLEMVENGGKWEEWM
ncbi:MAG: sigma 54-interacting transcriptional regulator [Thermosediminibacteraceae bacterium]|nr:sigma 54-interacting transcriptional regulator [Thermosediminibacteraceae bacterium]